MNQKPIISRFRYSRQVPVKTPKADVISKDLMRRGFQSVGPTVIYSFMQAAGLTNDHLISCYCFEERASGAAAASAAQSTAETSRIIEAWEEKGAAGEELSMIDLEIARAVDGLAILSPS